MNGLFLGYGVSVPFGPINVLILLYALTSFRNALFLGLGALSVDFLYLGILTFISPHFLENESVKQGFAVFGFCFLNLVCFMMLRKKPAALSLEAQSQSESLVKSFMKGLLLNASNPFVIGFWLSTSVLILQNAAPFFMLAGLVLAILSWVLLLSFAGSRLKSLITPRILFVINLVSAAVIEYFAINLLVKPFY